MTLELEILLSYGKKYTNGVRLIIASALEHVDVSEEKIVDIALSLEKQGFLTIQRSIGKIRIGTGIRLTNKGIEKYHEIC